MRNKKRTWNEQQWIEFGNRLKAATRAIQDIVTDGAQVMTLAELQPLWNALNDIRKAQSKMENAAAQSRCVRGCIVTRIFYGDELPIKAEQDDSN